MDAFEMTSGTPKDTLKCRIHVERFDATVTPDFKNAIDEAWSPHIQNVILDFAGVSFIDSSGVGALLSVQKKVAGGPQSLTLVNAGKNVVEVIELLRLHRIFNLNPETE